MNGVVIALFPGQKVLHWQPLRRRKMMDAVECQLGVGALAAGGFGRIQFQDYYGVALLLEMVWNFPDGFQCRVAPHSQPPSVCGLS